jgi:hypothetical protein
MRRGLLVVLTAAAALALAGGASSRVLANGGDAPPDPAGDSGSAPDLTTLSVENDDAGKLMWRIGIANRAALLTGDLVDILIDADAKDSTGQDGFEYVIQVDPTQQTALASWTGSGWQDTRSGTVSSSFSAGVLTVSVDFRELGSEFVRFYVLSARNATQPGFDFDASPNDGSFVFNVKVPLLLESLTKPKKVTAGKTFTFALSAWTDGADPATASCRARAGQKKLKARAVSAAATLAVPGANGAVVLGYKTVVLCTVSVPRAVRGKTVSVQLTAKRGGATLTQTFRAKAK